MQISRRLMVACVTTTFLFPSFLQAADTPAQIKARQALEQAMQELRTQPETTTPAPTPAPMAKPAVPAAPVAVAPPAPAIQPKPVFQPEPAPAVVPQARPQLNASSDGLFQPVPAPSSDDQSDKAREALHQRMADLQKKPLPPIVVTEPVILPGLKPNKVAQNTTGFEPLHGPPTGLSESQEQQLQALLQDYRSDRISPDEYQAGRAKILATR